MEGDINRPPQRLSIKPLVEGFGGKDSVKGHRRAIRTQPPLAAALVRRDEPSGFPEGELATGQERPAWAVRVGIGLTFEPVLQVQKSSLSKVFSTGSGGINRPPRFCTLTSAPAVAV